MVHDSKSATNIFSRNRHKVGAAGRLYGGRRAAGFSFVSEIAAFAKRSRNTAHFRQIQLLLSMLTTFLAVTVASFAVVQAADVDGEQAAEEARMEYICALTALSSYNDELNLFVRGALAENGFDFVPLKESAVDGENDEETAKMFLVKKTMPDAGENILILAVTGTEDIKDVKTDLKIKRVPFPANSTGAEVPTVHRGFYDTLERIFLNPPHEEMGGLTVSEALQQKLRADPTEKLYLTGHSLGGAVATLAAAELSEAGVSPKQLEVISFGAPAVGDERFAERYKDKFGLKRIVITHDPVEGVLQSVKESYVQQGTAIKRKKSAYGSYMSHAMAVYLDAAIRNYYDTREKTGGRFSLPKAPVSAKLYVAPINFHLDVAISADEKYMRQTLQEALAGRISEPCFAKNANETFAEAIASAKKSGCDHLIVTEVFGNTLKNNRLTCRLVMEETLYDVRSAAPVSVQSASTLTEHMTPIEAVMYLYEQCRQEREGVLGGTDGHR